MPSSKQRADKLLVDQGLCPSRERARALILAGAVVANDQVVRKPGDLLPEGAALRIKGNPMPYVSRGGLKLAHALDHFGLRDRVKGVVCLDVGASTGGFTDCLLEAGAARVYAVDVGYGQMAWKLRQDPRVRLLERCNARYLSAEQIAEPIQFATIDVSFISLEHILPVVVQLVGSGKTLVALIKPQFEVGRRDVGKGGVVRDPEKRAGAVEKIKTLAQTVGASVRGVTEFPIPGPAGNIEFLMWIETA